MKIVVVVPTYNERENLGPLLSALEEQSARLDHDMHVLVVDDNSPDGTGGVAREAGRRWPNVHLLTGEKRGLGVAYARGLTHALEPLGADAVVQMDADFSHNPADVPRLVAALEGGADFVIGSRYVQGGRAPEDWGPFRRGVSWVANFGARVIAGLYRVSDCTNGFRAIRATVLQRIDLAGAPPRGYSILMYLLYQALSLGAVVREVPVTFSNRVHGESKLRVRDAVEFFIDAWWIRYDRRERFYGLAVGGLSGIGANLAAMVLLRELAGLAPLVASLAAIEASVLYSFGWRHVWTVAAGRGRPALGLGRLLRFQLASAPSSLLTLGAFAILWGVLGVHYLGAQALGIVPALIWNYFIGERLFGTVWAEVAPRIKGLSSLAAGRPPQSGA